MLRNFVTDAFLEKFYPNIINNRQGGQVDYSETIGNAFDLLVNELQSKGIDPRLCMVPIDLCRLSTASQNIQSVTSKTTSATWNGEAWEGGNERRFVLNLTSKVTADDWSFLLQGSNLTSKPEEGDANWETVSTLQWDGNTAASEVNTVITSLYKWYRVRAVKNSGSNPVTFTATLYETVFDELIAYRALELIALSWKTGLNPRWDDMQAEMYKRYVERMEAIKFSYDEDQDGIPEVAEPKFSAGVRFTR